ncbi:gamma-glutamyltransferase [Aestuariicella hydrocarbonica]|uniref:Glutathione hydrolase proenzyme n=2 Tax=Pseudomaricurvus hydrocarbonicus TaxID=1470433 RepID=A0A9E5MJR5_9GAMM|nr:gamma-glutamyltransferase [Aestuariicella hydrocarbonica]
MENRRSAARLSRFVCGVLVWCVYGSVMAAEVEPIIRYDSIHHPMIGERGMVATQHDLASQVGADIIAAGGNAVDAAVAVGFSLAVVLPRAGNLGGGGFMMIYLAEENKTLALDYREMAPAAAHRDMFLDSNGDFDQQKAQFSHASAGVPGTVAGLLHAQKQYGRLSLKQVMMPAIRQAEKGFAVTHDLADKLASYKHLKRNPATVAAYYKPDGSSYLPGEVLKQPDLAWSLKQILIHGEKAFYSGRIADKIVDEMAAHGGLISRDDLANYRVVEREPVMGSYRGYQIASMPPPSSGGVHVIQMLNMLETFPMKNYGAGSAASIHHMVESMKWAYADRSKYLGDPDYVDVPVAELTNKAYAQRQAKQISSEKSRPSSDILPGAIYFDESRDTTHFSIMDAEGNAVANTYTLNFSFGSGITVAGTGILLNNEMDDFSSKPGVPNAYGLIGAEANKIEAGKRPLSSMTPTLVFKDGKPVMVTGSPGGSRIITTVLETIVNVVDYGMNVSAAVSAPRFHHQWQPDILFMEPGFSPDTQTILEQQGHTVKQVSTMGSANSVVARQGLLFGAADPRKPDASAVPVAGK